MAPRVWFITGSSTGFGRLIAERALLDGDKVFATLRKPEVLADLAAQYGKDRLVTFKLDVTKPEEITAAFAKAKEAFGRIDLVINNAGYGIIAEIEGTPDADARHLFEVIFWGAANVTREAVRFFREENKPVGGRLVQMSSMFGVAGGPGAGYYVAAKFALEGLTESLATELLPEWNIKIVSLHPGWFKTPMVTNNASVVPQHPAYAEPTGTTSLVREAFKLMEAGTHPALNDPKKLIKAIFEVIHSDDLGPHVPFGNDSIGLFTSKSTTLSSAVEKYGYLSKDLGF